MAIPAVLAGSRNLRSVLGLACSSLAIMTGSAIATPIISGDQGYEPVIVHHLSAGSVIDATTATFRVANSQTASPSIDSPCNFGSMPINRYPIQLRDSPGTVLRGGLFAGEVSRTADWLDTYCNSAAVAVRNSPAVAIEGQRMRQVWDAVRFSADSEGFSLRESWFSEVRDDCVENDFLNGGTITDSLFDGCFSGISLRPPSGTVRVAMGGPVVLRHVLLRMATYPYRGTLKQGVPLKADANGPKIEIYDSIFAMDNPNSVSKYQLAIGWTQIGQCSNNLLLWTTDKPWPESFARPPACFRLVLGAEAQELWDSARRNWINCHPDIARFAEDSVSRTADCDAPVFRHRNE